MTGDQMEIAFEDAIQELSRISGQATDSIAREHAEARLWKLNPAREIADVTADRLFPLLWGGRELTMTAVYDELATDSHRLFGEAVADVLHVAFALMLLHPRGLMITANGTYTATTLHGFKDAEDQ